MIFLLAFPGRYFFCGSFYFVVVFALFSCGHLLGVGMVTDFLALLCVMFSCVFVTFPYGFLGQVWYLIV